ncbi:MAG: heme-binding protein [Betaproteobacteria bacterium]|nr:heme-binding protein [Betaproteobacteria bacterium]
MAHATANGWKINVAVVDRGGNLMALPPHAGAFFALDRYCHRDSVYTSASFGFPTKAWTSIIGSDEA